MTIQEQNMVRSSWFRLPSPDKKVTELVRTGMQLNIRATPEAAKAVGIGRNLYQLVRQLLIISDRQVLSLGEQKSLDDILRRLDGGAIGIEQVKREADAVLKQHWHPGTLNGEPGHPQTVGFKEKKKDRRRLDNTLFAITEACGNNEEIPIPQLTRDERAQMTDSLLVSIKSLWDLMFKIRAMGE